MMTKVALCTTLYHLAECVGGFAPALAPALALALYHLHRLSLFALALALAPASNLPRRPDRAPSVQMPRLPARAPSLAETGRAAAQRIFNLQRRHRLDR